MQLHRAVINVAAQHRICHALIAASAGRPGKYMLSSFQVYVSVGSLNALHCVWNMTKPRGSG
jgi:hypothetical protein